MGLLGKLCKQDFNLLKKSNGFQEFEKALIFSILHIIQLFWQTIINVPASLTFIKDFIVYQTFLGVRILFSLYRNIHSTVILLSTFHVPGIDLNAKKQNKTVGLNQNLYPGYMHFLTPTPPQVIDIELGRLVKDRGYVLVISLSRILRI